MASAPVDSEHDSLHIGDYVLLKDTSRGQFLSIEGILLEDVCVAEGSDNLMDSIFCVHLQRQYSASRDLQAFLKTYNNDVKSIEDESAKKYLLALQKGRENEKKLNDTYMRNKYGQKIHFGDIIQLYHVKSRKYITVTDQLAKDERENTRIQLDVNGSAFSWIQIAPRFKIDKEGDQVINSAEMYLKFAERSNEYMHTADRNPVDGKLREVNCALETTSWRLGIYQSSLLANDPNSLMCAQLVTLVDPETRSNLTISEPELTSLTDEDDNKETAEDGQVEGNIILEPVVQDAFDSNCLWILESSHRVVGGPISWKTDAIRLRHFNSGKYLSGISSFDEEADADVLTLVAQEGGGRSEDSLFNVNEINSTNKYLSNGRAIQLNQNGLWLERGDIEEGEAVYPVKTTRDKVAALSLIINRYDGNTSKFKVEDSNEAQEKQLEPLDVYAGQTVRKFLNKYRTMIRVPKRDTLGTVWPKETRGDLEFFQFVADKTVYFSQGFPISAQNVQLGIDKGDNKLMKFRQGLLREQGSLEEVLKIINLLIPLTERLENLKAKASKRKHSRVSDEEIAVTNMAQTILSKCFAVVFYAIINNEENQMYVADFMPVLLAHLNAQPLAGKTVTEMLSKNIELQETKIGEREIQIFVDKLRSSRMNAMYLQLLQACCSCEGDGVDGNQCKVAKKVFSDTNDIIIQVHADHVRSSMVSWEMPSLYIPSEAIAGSPVRGEYLISKGLPKLSLAWTTNSIDFSPLGLFGKLSVNVEELFQPGLLEDNHDNRKARKAKSSKKSSADQKRAVANYFIAEMFLGAEMCMDRNYVAMHLLDNLFPYETLVTMLKLDVSSQLKAAAVRLLMCLHVDRDPQAASKIPCLTRTWSDIKKDTEPQLPFVDSGRKYVFGLIQQIISEHVKGMAGSQWDELSRHMLKMLKTMAQFNFYGTNERLLDVIVPLIRALDRRQRPNLHDSGVSTRNMGNNDQVLDSAAQLAVTVKLPVRKTISLDDPIDDQLTDNIDFTKDDIDVPPQPAWYVRLFSSVRDCLVHVYKVNYQAARSMALMDDSIGDSVRKGIVDYVAPLRYSKAPIYELETMVEAVDILAFAQKVIEDRNLSLLMRYFFAWESGADKRSPAELFEQVIIDSKQLSLDIEHFDDVMIDTLMFVHTPLVQSSLEVLMAHHSTRRILLDNAKNVQLLASHKRERQYKQVDQMLKQLEQNAETHELWGELETEADYALNKQTKDILRELADMCRIRRFVFEFDEDYTADSEMQDLLRNLNCFEICMKVTGLLESVEEDEEGNLDEVGENTKDLCALCNNLLYWFMLRNPKNQILGFEELSFFLDSLDDGINSHQVIFAIFSMNETLMRQVPHALLSELVDRMLRNGLSHHYLALFAAIPNVGNKNIKENQMEIVRVLTSPGVIKKLGRYLVPVNHDEYAEKRELMAEFLDRPNVELADLPPALAFHFMFLDVLSGCTVGQKNVSTVEAKVQSVFNYPDIIDSILDPGTMLLGKVSLLRFLFNAIFDVELKIPGMENSPAVWKLLDSFRDTLITAQEELLLVHTHGWESPLVSRRKMEFFMLIVMVIHNFFTVNFDISTYRAPEAAAVNSKGDHGHHLMTLHQIYDLIVFFFQKIKAVNDLNSPRLSVETKTTIFETLTVLKAQADKYAALSTGGGHHHKRGSVALTMLSIDVNPLSDIATAEAQRQQDADTPPHRRPDPAEQKLIARYREFLLALDRDRDIQYKAENENVSFIRILETLPYIADPVVADVRYETLIRKLVFHIRENIKMVNNQKRMDARVTATSTWIIRAFRTMIENRMGMSIYERDMRGGEEQDLRAAPVVNALNTCGGTALCLDLIADGIDEKLRLEAIKLGVGLLFKEGGALEVQGIMHDYLMHSESDLFFRQVRLTIQKLQEWHEWREFAKLEAQQQQQQLAAQSNQQSQLPVTSTGDDELPQDLLLVRFLQLTCEGHFKPNQELMREQPNNRVSYNLLDDFVNYLNYLSRIPCATSTDVGVRIAALILEVIQGPCEKNQLHFALNTELVETLNRLNRAKVGDQHHAGGGSGYDSHTIVTMEIRLKRTSIDILQALLEAQSDDSVVYDRVLSVVHLDIINIMSKKFLTNAIVPNKSKPPATRALGDKHSTIIGGHTLAELELQTECVILLQMFCTYKPSLYDELGISRKIEDIVGSGTAMIEIVWRGDIHRRFFHVPAVCDYLAKSSKDSLVENVDRSSAENKLIDFLARSHALYREVKHQEYLTHINLSRVFNRTNQNRATWINFLLSIVNNLIFLIQYRGDDNGVPDISAFYSNLTDYINAAQCGVATFTFLLWIVVSSPVTYNGYISEGYSKWWAIIYTALDPLTVYYAFYLMLCFLGLFVQNYYCSLQLLDIIVKDSTTRAVLMAIVTPAKQLVMAAILEIFVVYIFAFFVFFFLQTDADGNCDSLWNCLKYAGSYGFQNGGGLADNFPHTNGVRLVFDLAFFIVVLVVLLNVFLGMIIDTFGSLRAEKNEKLLDTTEVCFICGIEKQIFDRASDEPDGFQTHVKIDHNMWNYLYFIFLLWEQDKDDDDGLEQFTRRAIARDEITWFPINKAMRLERVATKAEIVRKDLQDALHETEHNVLTKLDDFQSDVGGLLQQLLHTLKQETPGGHHHHAVNSYADAGRDNKTAGGGDEDSVNNIDDSLSFLSDSSYLADLWQGRQLQVAIDRIEGLDLLADCPVDDAESEGNSHGKSHFSVQVRLLSDNGNAFALSSTSVDHDNRVVTFDRSAFISALDNVTAKDRRGLQLHILAGDMAVSTVMKTLAVLELSAVELFVPHDEICVVTKRFSRSTSNEESPLPTAQTGLCSLVLNVRSIGARNQPQNLPFSGQHHQTSSGSRTPSANATPGAQQTSRFTRSASVNRHN